jgi:hypothetical protein
MADAAEKAEYLKRYAEHNSRLQTWIGAYGAGLASLLIYQYRNIPPSAIGALIKGHAPLVRALVLIATGLIPQVLLLLANKTSQFYIAHADDDKSKWSRRERVSQWFSDVYLFDLFCDVASLVLLALATWQGLSALALV